VPLARHASTARAQARGRRRSVRAHASAKDAATARCSKSGISGRRRCMTERRVVTQQTEQRRRRALSRRAAVRTKAGRTGAPATAARHVAAASHLQTNCRCRSPPLDAKRAPRSATRRLDRPRDARAHDATHSSASPGEGGERRARRQWRSRRQKPSKFPRGLPTRPGAPRDVSIGRATRVGESETTTAPLGRRRALAATPKPHARTHAHAAAAVLTAERRDVRMSTVARQSPVTCRLSSAHGGRGSRAR
jgi:hypothetical protein